MKKQFFIKFLIIVLSCIFCFSNIASSTSFANSFNPPTTYSYLHPKSNLELKASPIIIQGTDWLQGQGVNVLTGLQCVELPQSRLYPKFSWPSVWAKDKKGTIYNGGAAYIPEGSPGLLRYDPGSGYVPVPGDLVIENPTSKNKYGHVSVVDYTDNETIHTVEQNASKNGRHDYQYNNSNYIGGYGTVKAILHAPQNNFSNELNNPIGSVDSLVGGTGSFSLNGWALDPNVPATPVNIRVLISSSYGPEIQQGVYDLNPFATDIESFEIGQANNPNDSVALTYPNAGIFHGFTSVIQTAKTGTVFVWVYALNIAGTQGQDTLLSQSQVQITQIPTPTTIKSSAKSKIYIPANANVNIPIVVLGTPSLANISVEVKNSNPKAVRVPSSLTIEKFGKTKKLSIKAKNPKKSTGSVVTLILRNYYQQVVQKLKIKVGVVKKKPKARFKGAVKLWQKKYELKKIKTNFNSFVFTKLGQTKNLKISYSPKKAVSVFPKFKLLQGQGVIKIDGSGTITSLKTGVARIQVQVKKIKKTVKIRVE